MKQRNKNSISIETKISQALHFFDKQTGAVVPNIEHSATYSRDKNYQNISDPLFEPCHKIFDLP